MAVADTAEIECYSAVAPDQVTFFGSITVVLL